MSTSSLLHQAAQLQGKIEELRKKLTQIMAEVQPQLSASANPEPALVLSPGRSAGARSGGSAPAPARRGGRGRSVAPAAAPAAAHGQNGRRRSSPLKGKKRASSPSGPLAPAVVAVLKGAGKPLNVATILEGLQASGYKFTTNQPKRNLAARIYRLNGVKQVGQGLFTTVE